MEINYKSYFKNEQADHKWFNNWVNELENHNKKKYTSLQVNTYLGKTQVWGLNTENKELESIVIFPGARTTALFWDFDNNLDHLGDKYRIYMVETNGLPNLSDGATPDIKGLGYGHWAAQVISQLGLSKTHVAGSSFGGQICMKLAITNPEKIKAAFLLNPGCMQPFSMSLSNLYYNILPIVSPSRENVRKFLNNAVFWKPNHALSPVCEKLIVDYEVFALTRYKDNTQKPYFMGEELRQVTTDTYLIGGDRDLLFPHKKSLENAKKLLKPLRDTIVFPNVGHGIETYDKAIHYIGEKIRSLK